MNSTNTHDYLLRVITDEIDILESCSPLHRMPHIAKFFSYPLVRLLLTHIQNFCWTSERYLRRRMAFGAREPQALSRSFDAAPRSASRPDTWLDITNTRRVGFHGGIERAALQLANAGIETGLVTPVYIEDGDIYEYVGPNARGAKLRFSPSVTYVIADSFWHHIDEQVAICEMARTRGSRVVVCIHDVILLYYPSFNRPDYARSFARAFKSLMPHCDACITSSVYTREKVRHFIDEMRLAKVRPIALTHFPLGANGHSGGDPGRVSARIRDVCARPNVFLSVGTLEPRKGYPVSLDAFDQLWARGIECTFLIIGRRGWLAHALERRIVQHPFYGDRLHWIDDASDAELTYAYRKARCVLQTSITEGFGLPIVEASLEGTPVIATDNEIFREIGGGQLVYFHNCDSVDLAAKVCDAIIVRPPAARLQPLTWRQSLELMVARVDEALDHHVPV